MKRFLAVTALLCCLRSAFGISPPPLCENFPGGYLDAEAYQVYVQTYFDYIKALNHSQHDFKLGRFAATVLLRA